MGDGEESRRNVDMKRRGTVNPKPFAGSGSVRIVGGS